MEEEEEYLVLLVVVAVKDLDRVVHAALQKIRRHRRPPFHAGAVPVRPLVRVVSGHRTIAVAP